MRRRLTSATRGHRGHMIGTHLDRRYTHYWNTGAHLCCVVCKQRCMNADLCSRAGSQTRSMSDKKAPVRFVYHWVSERARRAGRGAPCAGSRGRSAVTPMSWREHARLRTPLGALQNHYIFSWRVMYNVPFYIFTYSIIYWFIFTQIIYKNHNGYKIRCNAVVLN